MYDIKIDFKGPHPLPPSSLVCAKEVLDQLFNYVYSYETNWTKSLEELKPNY